MSIGSGILVTCKSSYHPYVDERPVVTEQPSTVITQVKNGRWAASCAPHCSACFGSAFPMSGLRTLLGTIIRVLSTACNHGQVSRGCMIMQSTTRRLNLATKRHKVHKRGFYFCVLCDSWWLAIEFCNRPPAFLTTKLQVGKVFRPCSRADKWNATHHLAPASDVSKVENAPSGA